MEYLFAGIWNTVRDDVGNLRPANINEQNLVI